MKKSKKIWIILASACIILGCAAAGAAAAYVGFDFTTFNSVQLDKKTYTITESFENIELQSAGCDVVLLPAKKDTCEIVCAESDAITHNVSVENDTLKIVRTDTRKWYEKIGVFFGTSNITVCIYLPEKTYDILRISSEEGNIALTGSLSLNKAELNASSGDITVKNTIAKEKLFVKSTSGNVSLESCDSKDIVIETTSGDVNGSLRSEKNFAATTKSGDTSLPDSRSSSQTCTVSTTSGDIRFAIE